MLKKLLKKMGFVHQSELSSIIVNFNKSEKKANLRKELAFNNRVFCDMPVIGINNYEDVLEIGIIKSFEIVETLNSERIIPVIQIYYTNRNDNFHKDNNNACFGQYVAFSEQRLKAYLNMNGRERTAMLIECYKYGTEEIESVASIAEKQPCYEDVMIALNKTSFFKDSQGYCV